MAFGEITLLKEFPAEMAGQRVGWSSVVERQPEDMPMYATVNLATATVGEDGARLGCHTVERDGETKRFFGEDSAEGFVGVAGLYTIVSSQHGVVQNGGVSRFNSAGDRFPGGGEISAASILNGSLGGRGEHVPKDEEMHWGESPTEVLGGLKARLSELGLEEHYPAVYYLFNISVAHEYFRHLFNRDYANPEKLYLPDDSMQETTVSQAKAADEVASGLESAKQEDERMLGRLTVFSDVPAKQIPETFASSRRKVGELEAGVLTARDKLLAHGLVYLPIGFRPSGRSWPYMDASVSNEQVAFGQELDALRSEKLGRAESELNRELKELDHRISYARQGATALALLAYTEQQAVA